MLTLESFLAEIDSFLKREGMSPTAFGKEAVGDPNLIHDLRDGRMPGLRLIGEVQQFMASREKPPEPPTPHQEQEQVPG